MPWLSLTFELTTGATAADPDSARSGMAKGSATRLALFGFTGIVLATTMAAPARGATENGGYASSGTN